MELWSVDLRIMCHTCNSHVRNWSHTLWLLCEQVLLLKKTTVAKYWCVPQLFFQVIMYFSMIEVGLLAQKWSAQQQWSVPQPAIVSLARSDGQPFAHARVLKVQSLFDRPRSIGQRWGSAVLHITSSEKNPNLPVLEQFQEIKSHDRALFFFLCKSY